MGELLSRYKSGPLPKAFKIIPSLPAWEDILYITGPDSWTPHATLAATRIFVSNLKAAQTQRFFELVLLDKIRNEIAETGKASYQTYEAIKKSLFKPAAFFKGILFPLCEVSSAHAPIFRFSWSLVGRLYPQGSSDRVICPDKSIHPHSAFGCGPAPSCGNALCRTYIVVCPGAVG